VGKHLIVLFVAALAVALVATGCGGGDSGPASITKAEFIEQADAACKKGEEEIQKDFAVYLQERKNQEKATAQDYAELVETVLVPNAEAEIDAIRALGAPSGDEKKVEAMLTAREESIEMSEKDPQAIIKDSKKIFGPASKLAKEYGLKTCGNR
jgi:hypothetical protein